MTVVPGMVTMPILVIIMVIMPTVVVDDHGADPDPHDFSMSDAGIAPDIEKDGHR